jgi:hypothetical protein
MSGTERCWAKEVSECGEGTSKEHDVTRGAFPGVHVIVEGSSPSPTEPAEAPVHDLAAEVLCKKHNAELSPLDTALIDLLNSIREIERLRAVRSKVSKDWPIHRFTVDGPRIERCVLKMVMNHASTQQPAFKGWRPPDWLPKVILGREDLKSGCGLGVIVRVGDAIVDSERIGFTFGQSERTGLYESVVLELRQGLRLVCSWETPVQSLGELRLREACYDAASDTLWHPRRVSFSNGAFDLGLSIDFDWSGKWTGTKHPAVSDLRKRFAPPARA